MYVLLIYSQGVLIMMRRALRMLVITSKTMYERGHKANSSYRKEIAYLASQSKWETQTRDHTDNNTAIPRCSWIMDG